MFFRLLGLFVLLTVAACTTVPIEDNRPPSIVLVQDYQGNVTLNWKSKPGYSYKVVYRDDPLAPYTDLPATKKGITGTGQSLTATDRVVPNAKQRREYSIREEKIK